VGPGAGLDRCGKSRHPPGFDLRTVQHVASRYTDYATRATRVRDQSHFTRVRKIQIPGSGFHFSGMFCSIGWWLFTEVLGRPIGPIFTGQAVQ
jgi:hypothetical protein